MSEIIHIREQLSRMENHLLSMAGMQLDTFERVLQIMSELTDLKNAVAELKKDSARALQVLGETRQALTDMATALEELKKSTNLNAEDRAAVDEIKTMVTDADTAIEDKVPEAPVPTPTPEPPAPQNRAR